MEFKGTKGIWIIDKEWKENKHGVLFLTIGTGYAEECIDVYSDSRLSEIERKEQTMADALLISKAPEMLEMLIELTRYVFQKEEYPENFHLWKKSLELIKEATEL